MATRCEAPEDAPHAFCVGWPSANVQEKLFNLLLQLIDPRAIRSCHACVADYWVKAVATLSVRNNFAFDLAKFPSFCDKVFSGRWECSVEAARNAMSEPNNDKEIPEDLDVDLGDLFAPLRFILRDKEMARVLREYYNDRTITKIMKKTQRRIKGDAPTEEYARALTAFETRLQVEQRNQRTEPFRPESSSLLPSGFDYDAACCLVRLVPKLRPDCATESVCAMASLVACMGVEIPQDILAAFSKEYQDFWGVALAEAANHPFLTAQPQTKLINDAFAKLRAGFDAEVFDEFLARHHVLYDLSALLPESAITSKNLSDLYMRLEGHGSFSRNKRSIFWVFGGAKLELKRDDKPAREPWTQFKDRVAAVLLAHIRKEIDRVDHEVSDTKLAQRRTKLLESALRRVAGSEIVPICNRCVDTTPRSPCHAMPLETDPDTHDEPTTQRKFPKLNPDTEGIILAICAAFGPDLKEDILDVLAAYDLRCTQLGISKPRHTSASTLCKELYRQSDSFICSHSGHVRYVRGMSLAPLYRGLQTSLLSPNGENLRWRTCKTPLCGVAVGNKYEGYCLRCFVHLFPDKPTVRNYKTKERAVGEFLLSAFPDLTPLLDKRIVDGCSGRRPDVTLDMGTHVVLVEIDENQHVRYDCSCENKRLVELWLDAGHRPTVFLRFNPDGYLLADGTHVRSCWEVGPYGLAVVKKDRKAEWEMRLAALREQVSYWIHTAPEKSIEVIQLYYDQGDL